MNTGAGFSAPSLSGAELLSPLVSQEPIAQSIAGYEPLSGVSHPRGICAGPCPQEHCYLLQVELPASHTPFELLVRQQGSSLQIDGYRPKLPDVKGIIRCDGTLDLPASCASLEALAQGDTLHGHVVELLSGRTVELLSEVTYRSQSAKVPEYLLPSGRETRARRFSYAHRRHHLRL